jgi:heat shock protein HslJ
MKLKLSLFALLALFVMSCKSAKEKNTNLITEKHWKLKTLEGKEIMNDSENRDIHFTLSAKENRVTGFTGCNSLFGTYTLEEGNSIRFSSLGSTKMACLDGDFREQDLLNVFNTADNYTIVKGVLSLNVGRRAPLAVFEEVVK